METIKFFLKWFLLMSGIVGAVGFGLSAVVLFLECQFGFAAGSAIATAFCIATAITSFECME